MIGGVKKYFAPQICFYTPSLNPVHALGLLKILDQVSGWHSDRKQRTVLNGSFSDWRLSRFWSSAGISPGTNCLRYIHQWPGRVY